MHCARAALAQRGNLLAQGLRLAAGCRHFGRGQRGCWQHAVPHGSRPRAGLWGELWVLGKGALLGELGEPWLWLPSLPEELDVDPAELTLEAVFAADV